MRPECEIQKKKGKIREKCVLKLFCCAVHHEIIIPGNTSLIEGMKRKTF